MALYGDNVICCGNFPTSSNSKFPEREKKMFKMTAWYERNIRIRVNELRKKKYLIEENP